MNTLTLASLNGNSTQAKALNWLEWTVKEFFTQVNWSDQPPDIQAIQMTTIEGIAPELSLQLTVKQFFSAIPWDGKVAAAPAVAEIPLSEEAPPSGRGEISVDDFADFF